jgi:hypothetical protein
MSKPVIREPDDQQLRDAFEALKSENRRAGATPDFGEMMARARAEAEAAAGKDAPRSPEVTPLRGTGGAPLAAPPLGRSWRVRARQWVPLAAAAAVAAIFAWNGTSSADREFERLVATYTTDLAGSATASPTDGLLRTPGLDLGAVPSFSGSLRGLGTRPRPDNSGSDGRDG